MWNIITDNFRTHNSLLTVTVTGLTSFSRGYKANLTKFFLQFFWHFCTVVTPVSSAFHIDSGPNFSLVNTSLRFLKNAEMLCLLFVERLRLVASGLFNYSSLCLFINPCLQK